MIRVVIDTNVLVSALLTSGGLPEAVINLAISGEVQWFASESVLAEYEEVLKRSRLAIDSGKPADAMSRILAPVSVVSPAVRVTAAIARRRRSQPFILLRSEGPNSWRRTRPE